MAENTLNQNHAYAGCCIILPTKHAKSIAIAPPFVDVLKANVIEYILDTDEFGTFSGEVSRVGNALECARWKCERALDQLGDKVEFALASEGSFGSHPLIPLLPCDQEILYFIDRKYGFHLHMSHLSTKTNYRTEAISSFEALQEFAERALFPSHALILRPNDRKTKTLIFKGINSQFMLQEAFEICMKHASNGKVWVETDMRAQFNPLRMSVIGELAARFAEQLATNCPRCGTPGWGKARQEKGLECSWCESKTQLIKSEIFACVKCPYEEVVQRSDGLKEATPANCQYCNP